MMHLQEQQLIEYRYGDLPDAAAVESVEKHLHDCSECRASYAALGRVLAAVDTDTVPERDADFEARMWNQLSAKLARTNEVPATDVVRVPQRSAGWRAWFTLPRLVPVAGVLALVIAAFFAGRLFPGKTNQGPTQPQTPIAGGAAGNQSPTPDQARDRVLMVAVGDHLDRAQMVLMEISNAEGGTGKKPEDTNIERQQQRAEELLGANRLYRQTAEHTGENGVASVLDELEPVLMEIAHSPSTITQSQLDALRKHIEARGLLLKVRVLDSNVRQKEKKAPEIGASQSGL
jgi:hypothetical protein